MLEVVVVKKNLDRGHVFGTRFREGKGNWGKGVFEDCF